MCYQLTFPLSTKNQLLQNQHISAPVLAHPPLPNVVISAMGLQDWAPSLRLSMQKPRGEKCSSLSCIIFCPFQKILTLKCSSLSCIIFCPLQKILTPSMDFQARRDHCDQPG